jgi:hypothetical protein
MSLNFNETYKKYISLQILFISSKILDVKSVFKNLLINNLFNLESYI